MKWLNSSRRLPRTVGSVSSLERISSAKVAPVPFFPCLRCHAHEDAGTVAHHSPWCVGTGASVNIYSAHDTTVFSILAALGAAEKLPIPRFASHLRMELWEQTACSSSKQFQVRLFYDSNVEGASLDDVLTESPACPEGTCSLDSFYKETRSRVVPAAQCRRRDAPAVTGALRAGCC